jgi:hypothetical protein
MSVKGKISSANSRAKTTLLPPYSDRSTVAAMGAYTTSVSSPKIGTNSEEAPITSMAKHIKSFPKSASALGSSVALINVFLGVAESEGNNF